MTYNSFYLVAAIYHQTVSIRSLVQITSEILPGILIKFKMQADIDKMAIGKSSETQ